MISGSSARIAESTTWPTANADPCVHLFCVMKMVSERKGGRQGKCENLNCIIHKKEKQF